jgi:hypothetical protein
MSILERTQADGSPATAAQVNFSVRPSLLERLDAAAKELETNRGALCRNIVESFLDAYVAWERQARADRATALEAIHNNIRSGKKTGARPLSEAELRD